MNKPDTTPSDAQLTEEQAAEVERQYDLARAAMLEEERKTEAAPEDPRGTEA